MLHGAIVRDQHAVGQEAEVRLMHAEHVLHGAAGDPDFLADDAFAGALTAREDAERDGVGVIDGELRVAQTQGRHRTPVRQRLKQLRGQLLDQHAPPGAFNA